MGNRKPLILASLLALVLCFQHCSDAGFGGDNNGNSSGTTDQGDSGLVIEESTGVDGGHFDLDTATEVYEAGKGDTNKHVHEYDDKYETNVVNFFNLADDDFDEVDEVVPSDQIFYIVVSNGDLSPRVAVEINGVSYPVSQTQHGPYSLSGNGAQQLNAFRALVATDAILNNGLVSTQTGCVVKNHLSTDGRYRNGALTFQIVAADEISSFDPTMGAPLPGSSLFWESTIFWHEDGGDCR